MWTSALRKNHAIKFAGMLLVATNVIAEADISCNLIASRVEKMVLINLSSYNLNNFM
jgi:hypothetical protein